MSKLIDYSLKEHIDLAHTIYSLKNKIIFVAEKILSLKDKNKKLLICGNGGSASDSQHLSAELIGRFEKNRRGFSAISISNDSYSITAIGNDFGFKNIFSRQIEALGSKGDILLVISTSGNSQNVINAVQKAKEIAIYSIGLVGNRGGELRELVDDYILVNHKRTARIQEMHILVIHIICELIEDKL